MLQNLRYFSSKTFLWKFKFTVQIKTNNLHAILMGNTTTNSTIIGKKKKKGGKKIKKDV